MNLVNNIYFVGALCGCELALLSQATYLLDAIIGCSVDLDYIHARAIHDSLTGIGLVIGHDTGSSFCVERLSKKTRGAGFAGSSRTYKEIRVGDSF